MLLFLEYPTCSTCQKAKKWLNEHNLSYEDRHIRECPPTVSELKQWQVKSGLPFRKFFNTSGRVYQSLGLKDKWKDLSQEQQAELLASDGMLVKRPILVGDDFVLIGFKPEQWEEQFR